MAELAGMDALRFWHRVTAAQVRRGAGDLTTRQMAILLDIYLNADPPHTVRGLADRLGLSKPVVSRALDKMGRMDLIKRTRDAADRRNVFIHRTVAGSVFLSDFSTLIESSARPSGAAEE